MTRTRIGLLMLPLAMLRAEVRTTTLREAIDLALKQNPELTISRLEELKAAEDVRIAHDPFSPRVVVGSGLAYSSGFPMSIEGSAPSVFQARAIQTIYNKPKSYEVAQAREQARAVGIDTAARRDDIAARTATLYFDALHSARNADMARQQVTSLEKVAATVEARSKEGRELPVEAKRAQLSLAQARQRLLILEGDQEFSEQGLAVVLGFRPDDHVRASPNDDRLMAVMPDDEAESVEQALTNSKEVKKLESQMQVRFLESRAAKSARYPVLDLVAQYALFAKFNHYEDYFRTFQRHNGQLGVQIQVPLFAGSGSEARAARSELEIQRLRTEVNSTRDRISMDTRRMYQEVRRAEGARDVAKLDLELTRDQLGILLAQVDEGRASLRQVEEARSTETEKWMVFYNSQHQLDRAKLNLLKQTGTILSALR